MALWREIAGYEGMYLVSDEGQIVSLPREVSGRNKFGDITAHRSKRVLKNHLRGRNGLLYECVALTKNGKTERISVHRLVAQAFIPNPDNLPEVNHIDKNTKNNRVENLEWCTRQYNIEYSKNKAVVQSNKNGVVARFKSITEASRATGIGRTSINNVLKGWSKTAGGYGWQYD